MQCTFCTSSVVSHLSLPVSLLSIALVVVVLVFGVSSFQVTLVDGLERDVNRILAASSSTNHRPPPPSDSQVSGYSTLPRRLGAPPADPVKFRPAILSRFPALPDYYHGPVRRTQSQMEGFALDDDYRSTSVYYGI